MYCQATIIPAPCPLADPDITQAIERLFHVKKGISATLIEVATHQGIVLLKGFTDSLLSLERVERIAQAVRGVRAVINELSIRTPDVPDSQLPADVQQALLHDPATADCSLTCTAQDGMVTAMGTVRSWAEKELVLNVVKGVRGVRGLVEEISCAAEEAHTPARLKSDAEITTQIRATMEWSILVDSSLVEVRTHDRVVHFSGAVGTAAEKNQVLDMAWAAGAARVDGRDLFVALWALRPELRGTRLTPHTDPDIAQAVSDALTHDHRVCSVGPVVRVLEGIVTLTGTVCNLKARHAAEQDAYHVVGVRGVRSFLQVRPAGDISDAAIQAQVQAALAQNPYVGYLPLEVQVEQGRVCLAGPANSHFEQSQAEEVAAGINGVVSVETRLQLPEGRVEAITHAALNADTPTTPQPDQRIAAHLRECLFWIPALHAQPINVLVEHGRVTLTGRVRTWHDRKQVAACAYECGARDVNNHLRVQQEPRNNQAMT
jgi:osmotically-inducible protein OsmY